MDEGLKNFLLKKEKEFNRPSFIQNDPICVPHRFSIKQDIEIAAFFAAIFAWGNRTTIVLKTTELMARMHNKPYEFIMHHSTKDLSNLQGFKHRTFNDTDLLYFVSFFRRHYLRHGSLETAFTQAFKATDNNTETALNNFYDYFFSLEDVPARTIKHIASPSKKSACKRLNMFLRWMVRKDKNGVDFGIWKEIKPSQLIIPLDVHVARVARRFSLINRKQNDWQTAVELTEALRQIDKTDPVRFDYSLFALGVLEKY